MKKILAVLVFVGVYVGVLWGIPIAYGADWPTWLINVLVFHAIFIGGGLIGALLVWAASVLFGGER